MATQRIFAADGVQEVTVMTQTRNDPAPSVRTIKRLLGIGVAGSLLFTATYLIEGLTRPGYDAWRQPISALSLGPGG